MSLYAARLLAFVCLFSIPLAPSAFGQSSRPLVSGTVLDETGRPVPRALVRITPAGAAIFADEGGRFRTTVDTLEGCRVEATLTGFIPAVAACSDAAGGELTMVLAVAPISDAILVTATRTEAPAGQLGASATVFSAADLERRQTPLLSELLRSVPGAMVVTSGAPGALTSLFVRGGESDYNKVLLDGVPLNEPGGAYYLNNLTTENVERIEVVRGAYSTLFGSDAMASVIQVFTRQGRSGPPRGAIQIDGGSYGTLHATAAVSGGGAAIDYSLGLARLQTDNRVPNNRLENTTLSANLGVRLAQAGTLRLIARGELEDLGTPGPTAFGRPDLDARFGRNDAVVGATWEATSASSLRQRATYSLAASRQSSTNLREDPPFIARYGGLTGVYTSTDFLNDSRSELTRHYASYQADVQVGRGRRLGDQRLTLLADWNGERAMLENRLAGTRTRHRRDNAGVALQQQMLWPRTFVTVGGRLEHNASFGTAFVPRGSVVVVAAPAAGRRGDTRLKFSAGAGIKEPTFLESYSSSPYFRGNPDLEPERSRSLEAGIEQRFAGDRAKVEFAWFHNTYRSIISLRTDPQTFEGEYFNVGVTRARGFDVSGTSVASRFLTLRASYTFLDSKILTSTDPANPLFEVGQWAFRRPRHSGTLGATIVVGRITADVNGIMLGEFVDSDFGLFDPMFEKNEGYATWDARLALRVTAQVTGLITVDNLADRDYSAPLGYQPLGRAIRAGARVGF